MYTVRLIPWCCILLAISIKQYSYKHDHWLSLADCITYLLTVRGNHRIFVITLQICKCSIFLLVLLRFDISCRYLYIFHINSLCYFFLCPSHKIINKSWDAPMTISGVVRRTTQLSIVQGDCWEWWYAISKGRCSILQLWILWFDPFHRFYTYYLLLVFPCLDLFQAQKS